MKDMDPPIQQDITNAEQAVLEALWEMQPATIRKLTDTLYPNPTATNFSTVQKLLERLEAKRFVNRKRNGAAYEFRSTVDRKELIGRRMRAVADSLCDGSLTPLLEHLVDDQNLTKQDRQSLHELLEKLEEKSKTKQKQRK